MKKEEDEGLKKSTYPNAIEWQERICKTCGKKFWLRKINETMQVYKENCSACRQKLGHRTAVDWIGWEKKQK